MALVGWDDMPRLMAHPYNNGFDLMPAVAIVAMFTAADISERRQRLAEVRAGLLLPCLFEQQYGEIALIEEVIAWWEECQTD